ncbi:hypothetical protein Acy02nite_89540 [Actinoplanes cyaneus]|uniref:Cellulose biosynthesis protein BcsQ n=1 Tax=Actinoplanes cyaneus TaxID=52696 RepID=A0A919ITE0_9ACTN|nr:hypothetical protein [Actinoplanes cyaneus]MCW2144317.1 hypothetical protein [Actinoplanes cyaneus]GID71073.1 hypothetical protein Acy02nite_89540 [Actinoplanes cyaneus]
MALIAVVSGKASPGATVTSLALALDWPRDVLLAECDPSGGTVLTGYLGGQVPADRGIEQLAVADYHGTFYDTFGEQLISLNEQTPYRLVLPGVTDPGQAAGLVPLWNQIGSYLRDLELSDPPVDVIADCGRIPALHAPIPLLQHADIALMIVGRTLSAAAAARPRLAQLRAVVGKGGGLVQVVVRGDGDYDAAEILNYLNADESVKVTLLADLPEDDKSATMLSTGAGVPRPNTTLRRALRSEIRALQALIEQRRTPRTAAGPRAREASRA